MKDGLFAALTASQPVTLAMFLVGASLAGAALGVRVAQVEVRPLDLPGRVLTRRASAVQTPWLRAFDAALRHLSSGLEELIGGVPAWKRYLSWQTRHLNLSGNPGNLCAREFPVVTGLLAAIAGAIALGWGLRPSLVLFSTGLGVLVPFLRVASLSAERLRAASRDMPRVLELLALCMSSGLDLVASLRLATEDDRGLLAEEVKHMLRTLEMGRTRREGLLELAETLPAPEVSEFCRAVIQAELKGASVREALLQQANMSRIRRTNRAEELAARAATLLIVPMMMLTCALLLLIVGPLLVGGVGF